MKIDCRPVWDVTEPIGALAPTPFQGETYTANLDHARLARLLDRVRHLMVDGRWRTLAEIQAQTGGSEASVSARLRDLRKLGQTVERRRRGNPRAGLFEYQVKP